MWSHAPASTAGAAGASPFGALRTTMPVRTHDGPSGSASHQLPPSIAAASGGSEDLSPIPWSSAYDAKQDVRVPSDSGDIFRVYTAGPAATAAHPPFVVLLLHGGGHSSMAWACVASHLKTSVHVLSIDLRGHGNTHTKDEADLSMARLTADVIAVTKQLYSRIPPLLIIGHSLGAALAVHVTASKQLPVCGLVMVDLVEGSAVDSLQHMRGVVLSRPSSFRSPAAAVGWALRVGALRNALSARFSLPDQLQESTVDTQQQQEEDERQRQPKGIAEEEEGADGIATTAAATLSSQSSSSAGLPCWRWRTDLLASEPYWSGWFSGLSALFLSCSMPKLLLLASAERLDSPLMVAHMQGKMQVDVLAEAGHSLQEDQPADTARKILAFVARHKMHQMANTWARGNMQAAPAQAAAAAQTSSASDGTTPAASSARSLPAVPLFDAD